MTGLVTERTRLVGGRLVDPSQGIDELADVVGAHSALDRLAHSGGNLLIRAVAVRELSDEIQQRRELHDLAVGAPSEVRGFLEARVLVLADQVDAVGATGLFRRLALRRLRMVVDRQNLRLLLLFGSGYVVSRRCRRGAARFTAPRWLSQS